MTHLAQPEGFVMLGGYLIGTWMLGLMPASYYAFDGGISWGQVVQCLLLQDLIQYMMVSDILILKMLHFLYLVGALKGTDGFSITS